MKKVTVIVAVLLLVALASTPALAQQSQRTPEDRLRRSWDGVHGKLLDMAQDFPEDKYTYKAHADVRTFAEELLHIAQVNATIAEMNKGREGGFGKIFGELAPDYTYTSKADTVAKFKKAMEAIDPAVRGDDCLRLIGLLEHAGEHYGKLVVYYRNNGMVPPASRNSN